jgi:hypothetical protein
MIIGHTHPCDSRHTLARKGWEAAEMHVVDRCGTVGKYISLRQPSRLDPTSIADEIYLSCESNSKPILKIATLAVMATFSNLGLAALIAVVSPIVFVPNSSSEAEMQREFVSAIFSSTSHFSILYANFLGQTSLR